MRPYGYYYETDENEVKFRKLGDANIFSSEILKMAKQEVGKYKFAVPRKGRRLSKGNHKLLLAYGVKALAEKTPREIVHRSVEEKLLKLLYVTGTKDEDIWSTNKVSDNEYFDNLYDLEQDRRDFIDLRCTSRKISNNYAYCHISFSRNRILTISGLFSKKRGKGLELLKSIIDSYGKEYTLKVSCYDDFLMKYFNRSGFQTIVEIKSTKKNFSVFREMVRHKK